MNKDSLIIKTTIGGGEMTAQTVSVNAVIDQAKFKPFHLTIVLWCLFIVIFDGYDLAINGVTLPLLMQEWNMTAVQAGMLASTALAGMMFGAMLFGKLTKITNDAKRFF